jgi:hypothetical protein
MEFAMSSIKLIFSSVLCVCVFFPLTANALEHAKQVLIGQYHTAAKTHALYAACDIDGTPEMQAMRAYGVGIGMTSNQLDVSEQLLLTYRDIYLQQLQHNHFRCTPKHKAQFQQDTNRTTARFKQQAEATRLQKY